VTELTVVSLFTGIGGLDLGLERAGMRVVAQSEIDPYCCRVLAKHWPDVPNLGDITTIDWSTVERPDLICGGYPCQPFSLTGLRAGADDDRDRWPDFAIAIRELRPQWVLLENVAAHLSLGFDRTLTDLAALGFDADWSVVSACSMGAPHRRRRLFCVAHASSVGRRSGRDDPRGARQARGQQAHGSPTRRSSWWATEPAVDRVAYGVPDRVDRARLIGNAVVPQVAEHVGRLIVEAVS